MKFIPFFILILLAGCSTTTVPELQFETGEALGVGHYRASADLESSRIVPFDSDPAAVAAQPVGTFQGGTASVRGELGVIQNLDMGVDAYITTSGGGWKLQAKYQWMGTGSLWASSIFVGYGITSGSGGVTYLGSANQDQQYLTINTLSLGIPFSRRLSPTVVMYAGPIVNSSTVNGLDNSVLVSGSNLDIGANVGMQVRSGLIEGKLEVALIKLSDPFSGGSRIVPYGGLSLGLWY